MNKKFLGVIVLLLAAGAVVTIPTGENGGQRDSIDEAIEATRGAASAAVDAVKESADDASEATRALLDEAGDALEDANDKASEAMGTAADPQGESVEDRAEEGSEMVEEARI